METIYYIKKGAKIVRKGDIHAVESNGTMIVVNLRTLFSFSEATITSLDMVNPKHDLTFGTKADAIKGLQGIVRGELERKRSQISAIEKEMAELEEFIETIEIV